MAGSNETTIAKNLDQSRGEMAISFEKDEWDAWREHPLTHWFMDVFIANEAIKTKQDFIAYAWGKREVDPIHHASLYERAQVLEQMRSITYEDIEAI